MSPLPRPVARINGLIPLGIRDKIRPAKRPWWSMFSAAMQRVANGRAFGGPFRGMLLGEEYYPQTLLGTYERELHPWLERIFAMQFAHAVDIGGGTGYYAAGLALRMPRSRITVFELTSRARAVITEVLRLNGVQDRVAVLGECTPELLAETIVDGASTFVLVDVEGAEITLLDPAAVPELRAATILVETHDLLVPGCRDTIARRFAGTHAIEEVTTEARGLEDFPSGLVPRWRRWFPELAFEAVRELRGGPQVFMLLTPRATRR